MVKATEAQGRPQSTQGCQCLLMPKNYRFYFWHDHIRQSMLY